jgi:hypothetical protein
MEKNKKRRGHQEGEGKMNDHGMGMASRHWKLLEEILKYGGKVFQFFGWSLLDRSDLGISLEDFYPMRSG